MSLALSRGPLSREPAHADFTIDGPAHRMPAARDGPAAAALRAARGRARRRARGHDTIRKHAKATLHVVKMHRAMLAQALGLPV